MARIIDGGHVVDVADLDDDRIALVVSLLEQGFADEARERAVAEDAGAGDARAFVARVAELYEELTGQLFAIP